MPGRRLDRAQSENQALSSLPSSIFIQSDRWKGLCAQKLRECHACPHWGGRRIWKARKGKDLHAEWEVSRGKGREPLGVS